ncbi:MAG: Spx/MgsR family RNA polymerase-binding regulatory protein [Staphylococcus epidermidis]|nr:Spx/MgsR family RNA polymerase-binding regulatory protein [Staphylococcus epidermidis]
MVTLFTSPSCTSCRKAKAWLQEHDIPYTERNIFSEHLTIDEIKQILKMTEDGTDEIISTRSKTYQNEDEIRRFLPRKVRTFQLQEAQRLVD